MDSVYQKAAHVAFHLALFSMVGLIIVHHNEAVRWRPILAKWLSFQAAWIAWQVRVNKGRGFVKELIARLAIAVSSIVAATLAAIDATSLSHGWDVTVHAISAAMLFCTFILAVGLALILAVPSLRVRFSAKVEGAPGSYQGL
jgi:hypothetical protein